MAEVSEAMYGAVSARHVLYENNNVIDAVEKINLAIESKSENIKALNYSENWAKVLGRI